jgi:phospholipase/carboxylesterase
VSLEHVIREPAGDPAGALVLSHGRGTDQHDLAPLLDVFDPEQRLLGICPGGPITDQPPGGRHWYAVKEIGYPDEETFALGFGALSGFLDDTLAERGIAWEDTIAGGFSQGGVMSHALGLGSGRPRPAGILAMSGFIPTVPGTWEADLGSRKDLPVMITHGELDPVISVDFGRDARDRLTEAGLDVTYLESRMPHTIDPRAIPEIAGWIAARFT